MYCEKTNNDGDIASKLATDTDVWNTEAIAFVPQQMETSKNYQRQKVGQSRQRGPVLVNTQCHDSQRAKTTFKLRDLM